MTVDAGSASVYGTKRLKIVAKDPASVPFQIDLQFGWSYRRAITITNTGSALTDFQVFFSVDTAALITAGKMQALGQDIRVTDSDETTQLSFWVESINTTTTKIWVKGPSIPNGTKTIYLYYGNANAADIQSGTNTFLFFDDFNTYDTSKWTSSGTPTASGGIITIPNGIYMTSIPTFAVNTVSVWRGSMNSTVYGYFGYCDLGTSSLVGVYAAYNAGSLNDQYNANVRTSPAAQTGGVMGTGSGYHRFEAIRNSTTNAIIKIDAGTPTTITTTLPTISLNVFVNAQSQILYADWVFVRKYVATEPTTAVGIETVPTTGIGSAIQTILKVAESSGNVGIRNTAPANILTIQQSSITDPIADSWTTWPCDRTTKTILRELIGPEALPELAKIRLYEWKKKPRRDDISMPKFNAARFGMMIDDPEVPSRILAYDLNGRLQGIDLLAYIGYLHVALRELSIKVAALEPKLPP